MNRTDRLYALVEELRASAPGRRSARELAALYEVSSRTIERDIGALQQAGVPVYADLGRRGGYTIDPAMTLPPLNFTPAEAVAIALALRQTEPGPFGAAGRGALRKILAAMAPRDAESAQRLAGRVRIADGAVPRAGFELPAVIERALSGRLVLELSYRDRFGETTRRDVEPLAVLAWNQGWYLVAWCRVREDVRAFRLDRIAAVRATGAPAPERVRPDEAIRCRGLPTTALVLQTPT